MKINDKNMTALILVGGYGTRLRPLTYTLPKPLVPFINMPILKHQIEALAKAGVKKIVLALNYFSTLIVKEVSRYEKEYNITIIYNKEATPLGTAGPLAYAKKYLSGDFIVLNSDVICDYPLKEMIDYHLSRNKEGTILITQVEDPSRYGLIITEKDSDVIEQFLEKSSKVLTENWINAGIYIFNSSILDRIDPVFSSLENEIFPQMAKEREMVTFKLKSFWMDIGQPQDYLIGQKMYLEYYRNKILAELSVSNIDIDNNVVLGKNVIIGQNVYLKNVVIFDNVKIGNGVVIKDSIIGWNSVIENDVIIGNCSVLGKSVNIASNCILNAIKINADDDLKNINNAKI